MGSVDLSNNQYNNMKFVIVALLIAAVVADEAYPKPAYTKPAYPAAYPKSYDYPAMPYDFAYRVQDDYTYNNYGHKETSDGKVVSGSYDVLLPDGRTQTVTYTVDDYSGYVAKVTYTGEAKYPEYKPPTKPLLTPHPPTKLLPTPPQLTPLPLTQLPLRLTPPPPIPRNTKYFLDVGRCNL